MGAPSNGLAQSLPQEHLRGGGPAAYARTGFESSLDHGSARRRTSRGWGPAGRGALMKREERMNDVSRRQWLGSAATLGVAAALAGTATAQGRPSADELIRTVKGAKLYDLSFTWNEQSPVLGLNPPYSFALNRTHKMTHEIFGQAPGSRVSWASEIMYFSGQHGAPTIDAIGHIGRDLKLHGGVDAVAATSTPGGIGANLGIDHFPIDLMLNRVVILDVARQIAGGRPDPLAPGFEITGAHLDATAKAQGVEGRPGDSPLIRTGWGQDVCKAQARLLGERSPG